MGVTTDNAANNLTFIDALEIENPYFKNNNHFRCFTHIINLDVQEALKILNNYLNKVRT